MRPPIAAVIAPFVLDIAMATAAGRIALGDLKPSPGAVLYLTARRRQYAGYNIA
jgi:hypothetical protein